MFGLFASTSNNKKTINNFATPHSEQLAQALINTITDNINNSANEDPFSLHHLENACAKYINALTDFVMSNLPLDQTNIQLPYEYRTEQTLTRYTIDLYQIIKETREKERSQASSNGATDEKTPLINDDNNVYIDIGENNAEETDAQNKITTKEIQDMFLLLYALYRFIEAKVKENKNTLQQAGSYQQHQTWLNKQKKAIYQLRNVVDPPKRRHLWGKVMLLGAGISLIAGGVCTVVFRNEIAHAAHVDEPLEAIDPHMTDYTAGGAGAVSMITGGVTSILTSLGLWHQSHSKAYNAAEKAVDTTMDNAQCSLSLSGNV